MLEKGKKQKFFSTPNTNSATCTSVSYCQQKFGIKKKNPELQNK
jgi:hypothetical protein